MEVNSVFREELELFGGRSGAGSELMRNAGGPWDGLQPSGLMFKDKM